MEKYIVSMAVEGRIDIEVRAPDGFAAFIKASEKLCGMDDETFYEKLEIVGSKPVCCRDSKGNLEDYNG